LAGEGKAGPGEGVVPTGAKRRKTKRDATKQSKNPHELPRRVTLRTDANCRESPRVDGGIHDGTKSSRIFWK
jgi:hypothetical protein